MTFKGKIDKLIPWACVLILALGVLGAKEAAAQFRIGFEPAEVTLAVGESALVEVVVSEVPAPGLAAVQFNVIFAPATVNVLNPNEAFRSAGIAPFAPLGGNPFCGIVRGVPAGPCPDPDWFLTSTGRTPTDTDDAGSGFVEVGYGTRGDDAPPTGSGTIAIVEIAGVADGSTVVRLADVILAGNQDPPLRFDFEAGTLTVQVGDVAATIVPPLVGQLQAAAEAAIAAAGLVVGTVTTQDDLSPAGTVLEQSPVGGTEVLPGSAVNLVVSSGPVTVPDVVGQSGDGAQAAIVVAGLVVGTVTTQNNTAAAGTVLGQAPDSGTEVLPGSAVNLVVSSGPATVPNVVGQLQAAAEEAIAAAGLVVGAVTTQDDVAPAGEVLSQSPDGGTDVLPGSVVDLVVSSGPATVPGVVGQSQGDAEAAIVAAGLVVGAVTTQDDVAPAGKVLSQSPDGGTDVLPGSAVDLVVSSGPATVPGVVGQSQGDAETAIVAAGLIVGTVTTQDDLSPAGEVLSQSPDDGTDVLPGSAVDLVVSSGPATVPGVVGQAQGDAETAIVAADLVVGAVTTQDDVAPAGEVLGQSPDGGTDVLPGSAVDLVVSSGPATVPGVVGQSQGDAEAAIVSAGLVVGAVTTQDDVAPAGEVLSQSPDGGTDVLPGSAVDLVVSSGPATVPGVVGQSQGDAEAAIVSAGLVVGAVTTQDDVAPAGEVLSQSPDGGTDVLPGSVVDLVVSSGPATVPGVVGQPQVDAEAAIVSAGLVVGAVTTQDDVAPAGEVLSQSPDGGTDVLPGSAVNLVVSSGPATVPGVVGQSKGDAEAAIVSAGLVVGTVTTQDDAAPAGEVLSQNPDGGTEVAPGSVVNLVVSAGPVMVPDVVGQPQVDAETAIVAAGLVVGAVTTQDDLSPAGEVLEQSPTAGSGVLPGSAVDLVVSSGPATVPGVVGQSQGDAEAAIVSAGLVVGAVTTQDDLSPAGEVLSQSPDGGTDVLPGSAVDLVVSSGPATVPGVVGQAQGDAETAIVAADLVVGAVTTQDDVAPAGEVLGQSPDGGTDVLPGSAVDLVVSSGPATVPGVVGQAQGDAETAIVAADLVVGAVTTQDDVAPAGEVLGQSPDGGTDVLPGSAVDLVVSSGPATVPGVVGQSQVDAEAAVVSAGLVVGAVTTQDDVAPAGEVLSQSPDGGTDVLPGSAVNLVVSSGPATVPGVVGQSQGDAEAAIVSAGLVVGTVTTQDDAAPAGEVLSQNPDGGTEVLPDSAVNLVVSAGPVMVPDVVGQAQGDAETAIVSAGLVVGTVATQNDLSSVGTVLEQSPTAGSGVLAGSAVNLVVSSGPATVPNVVGQLQAAAEEAIAAAGLVVGTVTTQDNVSPAGTVLSQSPDGGAEVLPDSAVNLVVSSGPVTVPNLVGQLQAAAEEAIAAAGLELGGVTTQDDVSPAGTVLGQSPDGGTEVLPDSAVNLVVSSGPATVPDVVGQLQAAAEEAIAAAGLVVGTVTTQDDVSPAGTVLSQSPDGGTEVLPDSAVNLVVSSGPVTVPNLVGQLQAAAEEAIAAAGLELGEVTTQDDVSPAGTVLSQSPDGGAEVLPDSAVNLVVSSGPVTVPNVVGQLQAAAEEAIAAAGLVVGTVTTQDNVSPAGTVLSQSPDGGAEVLPDSAVNLVVSSGPATVPGVVGQTQGDAEAAIVAAGLVVGTVTTQDDAAPAGEVLSQNPDGGTEVLPDSAVNLVVSAGPVMVPDVVGQAQGDAETAIVSAGLVVGTVATQNDLSSVGTVLEQSPTAGSGVLAGSAVNLVVSSGSATVPNVVGQLQAAAGEAIAAAGLVVGPVATQDDVSPAGTVLSQSPDGGAEVLPDSPVILVVSSGPATVPGVVGQLQAAAEEAIAAAGLVVGPVATQDDVSPAGTVLSQSPDGGAKVLPGSAVNLVVSSGPATMPCVVGQSQGDAETALVAAGLVVGTVATQNDLSPAGTVLAQSPGCGTEVLPGSAVNLVLSSGPATVPNVVGQLQAAAEEAIAAAGLVVGTVTTQDDVSPAGTVLGQSPDGGTEVLPDIAVNLVVSAGQGNQVPAFTEPTPDDLIVNEGDLLEFTVEAIDPDGDPVHFEVANLPAGADFTDNFDDTATFRWMPDYSQMGPVDPSVMIMAFDDQLPPGQAKITVRITVGNTNRPPQFVPARLEAFTVDEGDLLTFDVVAEDPDGDPVSFSEDGIPAGATLVDNDDDTATFNWRPGFEQADVYEWTVIARDDQSPAGQADKIIRITVGAVNEPPILTPIGKRSTQVGVPLTFFITATDPDGDDADLLFFADALPPGARLDPVAVGTAKFSWTPDTNQLGDTTIEFVVEDDGLPTAEATYEVVVISVRSAQTEGDVDDDGDVDRNDLMAILSMRNKPSSGPDDPRDLDGDGMITVLDARKAVLQCTMPGCAIP